MHSHLVESPQIDAYSFSDVPPHVNSVALATDALAVIAA
jgi:hypothetical protein